MAKKKVTVVVLNFNGLDDTKKVIEDILNQTTEGLDVSVILIDNGSTIDISKDFKNFTIPNMNFTFIRNEENLGFAGGNNVGIKKALKDNADYIVLLNNDVILPKDLLFKLVKEAEKDKKIGLLSPKMYFAKGYEFHKERYDKKDLGKVIWYAGAEIDWDNVYTKHTGVDEVDNGKYDKLKETDVANGACLFIRRELVEDIGYLDDDYFVYWEDADYSQRAKKAGWKVVYTPETHLWHKVSKASGIGSDLNDYFLTRNRMIFGIRYAGMRAKFALIKESLKLLIKGRKWQGIAIKDYYSRKLGKGSWGKNE